MGRLIVIEGLDGSGKATQTQRMEEALNERGIATYAVSFPNYKSNSSALVHMYLGGEFGTKPGEVNPYAASAFYSVDRYASFAKDGPLKEHYHQGHLILADRYTTSNIIHQCAKLPREEWQDFVAWLEDLEYTKMGIPRPQLVVYLDVETEVSQQLLKKRYGGIDAGDIHETDLAYLQRCREVAHWCVGRLGWKMLACTQNGRMRAVEEISEELEALLVKGM